MASAVLRLAETSRGFADLPLPISKVFFASSSTRLRPGAGPLQRQRPAGVSPGACLKQSVEQRDRAMGGQSLPSFRDEVRLGLSMRCWRRCGHRCPRRPTALHSHAQPCNLEALMRPLRLPQPRIRPRSRKAGAFSLGNSSRLVYVVNLFQKACWTRWQRARQFWLCESRF